MADVPGWWLESRYLIDDEWSEWNMVAYYPSESSLADVEKWFRTHRLGSAPVEYRKSPTPSNPKG